MNTSVIITQSLGEEVTQCIARLHPDSVFVLVDTNTNTYCLPVFRQTWLQPFSLIDIAAGDDHKNAESLAHVWQLLSAGKATRNSLLINLGGGMITDLGGFAASTFKRGIRYINIPTTLLGAVDAAVGGKTGINFNGLKNEVGVIRQAEAVILFPPFFSTLDERNMLSGYAEMLKHALLKSYDEWRAIITIDFQSVDYQRLGILIQHSIEIKEDIVRQDPVEKNIRKALNLGHTIGHAFESFSYTTNYPLLHGYAVAFGLACELYLSHVKLGFPKEPLQQLIQIIKENYGIIHFGCAHYETLYELMTHDKKNDASGVNFTLLSDIGQIQINQHSEKDVIFESFDFLRESLGF